MKNVMTWICAGVLMSALCAAFTACNDGTEDPDIPFTEYSFEKGVPGQEISAKWVNLPKENNTLLVINSDEELKTYVEGDYPPVDFTKKTLLLAYENFGAGHYSDPDKLSFRQTSEQEYVMTVNIPPFLGSIISGWEAAIVVDKLGDGSKVELIVTLLNLSELKK